jgi:DNA-binding NarL/FixJ family response regulator
MNDFRILVADDHPIVRSGLCSLLGSQKGWEVCGEAGDGQEAVEKCKQLKPDLLILDICLPKLNGVDVARRILKDNPVQRILVFTEVSAEQVVRDCLDAGVRGWVFKSDSNGELTAAVGEMQRNKPAFSALVSDLVMDGYLRRRQISLVSPMLPRLSSRQREVLQLISEGKNNKSISTILNISVKTTETHRSNMMEKLNIHSIAGLVMYAVNNEVVHIHLPPVLQFPQATKDAGTLLQRKAY